MNRYVVMVSVAALMACASVAAAAELDLGVRGGYQRIADADEGGFLGGAFVRTDWRGVLFFEGALLYNSEDGVDDAGNRVEVEFIPVQLSVEVFFLRRDETFCPYILAGAGSYIVRTVNEALDDSDTDFDFGWHLGLGLDYVLTEKIFLEADLRYIWLDVDTKGRTFSDTLSDFNSWQAVVGMGFRI